MALQIETVTARIIHQIWADGSPDKAVLAALRNSASILSRKATAVWPIMFADMQKEGLSHDGRPTNAERAIFAALHCYALYQQGNDNLVYAHAGDGNGANLFAALAGLRQEPTTQTAIDRRVQTVLGNNSVESIFNIIFHLVGILKSHSPQKPIDFAQLSQDFYYLQLSNDMSRQVSLKWGRQYYQIQDVKEDQKGE